MILIGLLVCTVKRMCSESFRMHHKHLEKCGIETFSKHNDKTTLFLPIKSD